MKLFRGNLIFTKELQHFTTIPRGYIAVEEDGTIADCYPVLPEAYAGLPVRDFGERLRSPASPTAICTPPSSQFSAFSTTPS